MPKNIYYGYGPLINDTALLFLSFLLLRTVSGNLGQTSKYVAKLQKKCHIPIQKPNSILVI